MTTTNDIKTVLVTGNLGYIGTVLTPILSDLGYTVHGLDTEFYDETCQLYPFASGVDKQVRKDVRDVEPADFEGVDAVIHLASLSNDPLGEFDPSITEAINYTATMRVADCARTAGASRFVYASSQSMYGVSDTSVELDEDDSEKNPVTAYAKTKWRAECELRDMVDDRFLTTFFRPSTVFGASPRLRCDIVFNNLVACAHTTNRVEIMSDGTPWRPVIHIRDVCSAFISGLTAPRETVAGRAFNVGIENGNFTVRDLAEAAQRAVPGSDLVFTGEHVDSRTYRVGFNRILTELKGHFMPEWGLDRGGQELVELFKRVSLTEEDFRGEKCIRLMRLKNLISQGQLDSNLRWKE
ncbi:NAD-dependent epimerase/dehydratase family protein [Pseudodesulfovibrio piezophilus]|uniref:NAD-dependent epimerase/dehydratase n=1 Tax=Pseudodesulfovibrio piezophilus (strain DSM 21447 / JCM 15486 / C1TLV30) TaxID=1322246 RepID=M1WKB5_PSEP2